MIIGVISDIHGRLSAQAYEALRGCDYILCAGDVEGRMVLTELETIAPTICVRGNCDRFDLGPQVENIASPLLGGVRFRMVHRPEDIGIVPEDVKVVIHGHTHIPREEYGAGGVLFLNPGSPTRPRGGSVKSLARLFVDQGAVKSVEFIDLDQVAVS
jgi:hypothetical protein